MAGKFVAIAAIAAVCGGLGFARPDAARSPGPSLGLVYENASTTLVRLDPETLRVAAGPRLDVGTHGIAWSFSRDRSRLALGGELRLTVPDLLLVDASSLTALGRVQVAPKGELRGTTWLSDDRLLAVVDGWDAGTIVATVDVARKRVVGRKTLDGSPLQVEPTGSGMAILLAPARTMAPARLAVVRASGEIGVATIARIRAGTRRLGPSARSEFRVVSPGLAVDRAGARAYVVGAGDEVAQVDLRTLAVAYRRVTRPRSLVGRLAAWLQPAAQAKSFEGPQRFARWLGGGLVAVSGGDYAGTDRSHSGMTYTPAGVRLIDTRTWTARTFARGADSFRLAGDLLLATSATWSSELRQPAPVGLVAYGLDGRERFHLHDGVRVWLAYADERRAVVDLAGPGGVEVVELPSGRVLEQRDSLAVPLAGEWSRF